MTRVWAETAPSGNIEDPDVTSPGKFSAGWVAEIPPFENFNFLQQLFTQSSAYLNQEGIGYYDAVTDYIVYSLVKGSDGDIYVALKANGESTTPVDPVGDTTDTWFKAISVHELKTTSFIHDMDSDADYTLDFLENYKGRMVVTDTSVNLTAPRNIIVGDNERTLFVENDTLQDLTFKTLGGTGITITPGASSQLIVDGTNVVNANVISDADRVAFLSDRKNKVINGDFTRALRGTSHSSPGYGSIDRWYLHHPTSSQLSQQTFALGQTDVPDEPEFYGRVVRDIAASINNSVLEQRIEGVRTFAGQQVTVSFYARCNIQKTFNVGLDQIFGTGGSPSPAVGHFLPFTAETTWSKIVLVFNLSSIVGKTIGTNGNDYLGLRFIEFSSFSTFNLDVSHVQVEKGGVATDFESILPPALDNLCDRYFQVGRSYMDIYMDPVPRTYGYTQGLKTPMRAAPTMTGTFTYSNANSGTFTTNQNWIQTQAAAGGAGGTTNFQVDWQADAEL